MIRIGQIGMAHDHAEGKMLGLRSHPEIFDVVAVAEDDPQNRERFGRKECYRGLPVLTSAELLAIPALDAVVVETEELKLIETAQRCIDRGLHVHVDKPGGTDIRAFARLLDEAKKRSLTVQMAYMYRYNPAVMRCLELVRSGALGEIYQVDAIMDSWHTPEKRKWMKDFPAGNMFYLGCHMVDLILLMAGIPERIVPFNTKSGLDGTDAVDHGFAVFVYKNGISTARATSTEVNGFCRRQLVVCGSKGTVEIKPLERTCSSPDPVLTLSVAGHTQTTVYTNVTCDSGRYDTMLADFAEMVCGRKADQFTYEYELAVQKAVLSACGVTDEEREK